MTFHHTPDLAPFFEEEARRAGVIDMAALEWMAPIAEKGWRDGQPTRAILAEIRAQGPAMSREQKRAERIRTNTRIGMTYWNSLTAKGREDPVHCLDLVLARAMSAACRERDRRVRRPGWLLRFTAVLDGRTCEAAKRLHGQEYQVGAEPRLPLPDCTADHCRCSFMHYPPRLRGRFSIS